MSCRCLNLLEFALYVSVPLQVNASKLSTVASTSKNQIKTRRIKYGTALRNQTSTCMAEFPGNLNLITMKHLFPKVSRKSSPFKTLGWASQFHYPSVTTILQCTMPVEQRTRLEKWEMQQVALLGLEQFLLEQEERLRISRVFHDAVSDYVLRRVDSARISKSLPEKAQGYFESILPFLDKFGECSNSEGWVTHWNLCYKGRFDAVFKLQGHFVLVDWKTTSAQSVLKSGLDKRNLDWYFDYPLQVAAYMGAINADGKYTMGRIDKGILAICYETGDTAKILEMSGPTLFKYWNKWLKRLENFWRELDASPQGPEPINFVENCGLSGDVSEGMFDSNLAKRLVE